jgi:hypothetical protein
LVKWLDILLLHSEIQQLHFATISSASMSSPIHNSSLGPLSAVSVDFTKACLGPVLPGHSVVSADPPPLDDVQWLYRNQGTDESAHPGPSIAVPTRGYTIQGLFPKGTAKPEAATCIYALDLDEPAPGSLVLGTTKHIIRHELDCGDTSVATLHYPASDRARQTTRQMSYRGHARQTAHVVVANQSTAMMINLGCGGPECHLTIDPSQTGRKSMTVEILPRCGGEDQASEYLTHVYYEFKDGKIELMEPEKESEED